MKPFTHELRKEIDIKIKNQLDIADLIEDVDIRNQDLSYAVISKFDRQSSDISNCNLSRAVIGKEGQTNNLCSVKANNVIFKGAKFLGKTLLRHADLRNSNFTETYMPYVEYQYADFRGCRFCAMTITIGSREGLKAKFDKNFMEELTKYWQIE